MPNDDLAPCYATDPRILHVQHTHVHAHKNIYKQVNRHEHICAHKRKCAESHLACSWLMDFSPSRVLSAAWM